MKIGKKLWGMAGGRDVFLFELDNGQGMRACISNYGGVLQSLFVKDASGRELDVVLGYDTLEEYCAGEAFFGAMIGPVADRVGGGRCVLGGEEVRLPLNAGADCMHSGPQGFHGKVWDYELLCDGVAFTLAMERADTGFPGRLEVRMAYRMPQNDVLRLEYFARCDRETAVSFTNHSYFNLDGGDRHCRGQMLAIHASRYAQTEGESDPICTGIVPCVEDTPFDLRTGRKLGEVLANVDFPEIRTGGGVDHYFLVDGAGMREHVRLESADSGLILSCRSDAQGVLVYTGNGLTAERGKGGRVYGKNWAVCMETERFPNGVNLPDWRAGVLLTPGDTFESATEFVFSRAGM